MRTLRIIGGTFVAVASLSGCVIGVNKVQVTHSPLVPIANKREGIVGVKRFTDERREGDRQEIGIVRSALAGGPVVGSVQLKNEAELEVLLTGYIVEALKEVGYQAVIIPPSSSGTASRSAEKVDAILEGEIRKFWVETKVAAQSDMEVFMRLRDPKNGNVLWTASIQGHGKGTLWMGAPSEFEGVIRQALDEALNQAATEFASDAFFQKVKNRIHGFLRTAHAPR